MACNGVVIEAKLPSGDKLKFWGAAVVQVPADPEKGRPQYLCPFWEVQKAPATAAVAGHQLTYEATKVSYPLVGTPANRGMVGCNTKFNLQVFFNFLTNTAQLHKGVTLWAKPGGVPKE